jgi:hypothetical protein
MLLKNETQASILELKLRNLFIDTHSLVCVCVCFSHADF